MTIVMNPLPTVDAAGESCRVCDDGTVHPDTPDCDPSLFPNGDGVFVRCDTCEYLYRIPMSEIQYYIVELVDATYHHTTDEANEHRLGVPIVDGPYDTKAAAQRDVPPGYSTEGYAVVPIAAYDAPPEMAEA